MAWCLDAFTITVTGGDVPCDLEIGSDFDPPSYSSNELTTARTVNVPFVYEIGAPQRDVFVSGYAKRRQGATGVPPDLGTRSFAPAIPDVNVAANVPQNAVFSVVVPARTPANNNELGEGVDNYDISVIIKESADAVSGIDNLQPANP